MYTWNKNHHSINIILISTLLFLSACGDKEVPYDCQSATCTEVQQTLKQTIDTYINANQSDLNAGLGVLVKHNGIAVYKESKGMANALTNIELVDDTGYRLASLSKTFTALAIMQQIELGALALDDSILLYIPELSESWSGISIHHLLSHQSGIPDYQNDWWDTNWLDGLTNQGLIDYFVEYPSLEFNSGEGAQYSNSGFTLLAEIVSRLSGMSFTNYMQTNIFTPVGMLDSYILNELNGLKEKDAINFATEETIYGLSLYTNGSMGQVSSLNDFERFFSALLAGDIVQLETLSLMTQRHSTTSNGQHFGYGIDLGYDNNNIFSGNIYGHTGKWDSFTSLFAIASDIDTQLVILTNGGDATNTHRNNITELIKEFYGQ
jgi:D-alanyl-D-alanine carboxypeptidase